MTNRTVLATLLLFVTQQAVAAPRCDAPLDSRHQQRLDRFADRLEGADTVEDARQMALRKIQPAAGVLNKAKAFAPRDAGLAEAHGRLADFRADVAGATSSHQVASQFRAIQTGGGGCDMTTGEVIATVLGFVLGIVPGIILLILLC